jgi:hypothetical protein
LVRRRSYGGWRHWAEERSERKLIPPRHLPRICPDRDGSSVPADDGSPAHSRTARIRPARPATSLLYFLIAIPFGLTGCGHATVPCPTPTSDLDRLRAQSEELRDNVDKSKTEEDAWEARRDAAAQRVREIEARRDSLRDARTR